MQITKRGFSDIQLALAEAKWVHFSLVYPAKYLYSPSSGSRLPAAGFAIFKIWAKVADAGVCPSAVTSLALARQRGLFVWNGVPAPLLAKIG
jgi:hypothetical protein